MSSPPNAGPGKTIPLTGSAPVTQESDVPLLTALLIDRGDYVLDTWLRAQLAHGTAGSGRQLSAGEARDVSAALLEELTSGLSAAKHTDLTSPEFAELVKLLSKLSKDQANRGASPTDTALTVFLLKDALGAALNDSYPDQPEVRARETRTINAIVDNLGLTTFEAYTAAREIVIASQQQSLLELSTPVVRLWEGVLAVPLIGTLDSSRSQMVMEGLLQAIVDTGSQVAIIDITGVPIVDTVVAQHLLKTVQATRLMGADTIISGIRPQIAQSMVHLGVEMTDVITKSTLADAFRYALEIVGARFVRDSSKT